MANTRFSTIDDYIASKPKDAQLVLQRVRKAIRRGVTKPEEGISYQIPVIRSNGVPILYFAGWKAHYSLYPASDALVAAFKRELDRYERSKGTIKFPLTEPVPTDLITRIARFRAEQVTEDGTAKSGRKNGRVGQLDRLRRMCARLPTVSEKLSHGAPTFFVDHGKGAFAIFANDHHNDGRVAVWVPVKDGLQRLLIEEEPATYFKPPYVGTSGWVGVDLMKVSDDALKAHLREAWDLIARKAVMRRAKRGT